MQNYKYQVVGSYCVEIQGLEEASDDSRMMTPLCSLRSSLWHEKRPASCKGAKWAKDGLLRIISNEVPSLQGTTITQSISYGWTFDFYFSYFCSTMYTLTTKE